MNKIKTLFKRDDRFKVTNECIFSKALLDIINKTCVLTEKVDGKNVRLTIRNEQVVRVEARKNPTKEQKKQGIIDAWYRDAVLPEDKHIFKAVENRSYLGIADGSYSAEAFGGKIQGNPLDVDYSVFIFSIDDELNKVTFPMTKITYENLKEWLPKQRSHFNKDKCIEGIVIWDRNKPIAKIKIKDFI